MHYRKHTLPSLGKSAKHPHKLKLSTDIEICGRCTNLVVAASGGADADFEELIAESVSVAASGGADVIVYATKSLEVNASGGADVYYGGNPANKSINKAGGADVSAMD